MTYSQVFGQINKEIANQTSVDSTNKIESKHIDTATTNNINREYRTSQYPRNTWGRSDLIPGPDFIETKFSYPFQADSSKYNQNKSGFTKQKGNDLNSGGQ